MSKRLNSLGYVAVGYGALITLYLLIYSVGLLENILWLFREPFTVESGFYILLGLLGLVIFGVWSLAPFAVLFLILKRTTAYPTVVGATVLSVLFFLSTYLYYESMILYPDPQGALIFVFLPLYQFLAMAACFGGLEIISVLRKKFTS